MNTYEAASLTTYAMDNFLSALGVFFTITTAYIVAAYIVGKKLTLLQLTIVNGTFLIASSIMAYLVSASFRVFYIYAGSNNSGVLATSSSAPVLVNFYLPLNILLIAIIIGCFIFMYSIRKEAPK